MTVGRSEQAKTLEVDRDRKVLSTVGCVPRVTFLRSLRAPEGRTVEVPYRGDVENTIRDVLGGLRSTCTYVGAAKLKELSRRTTFIRVTQQSSQMFT